MKYRFLIESDLEKNKAELEQKVLARTKELNDAKEQAEKSEYIKTMFLANMSHEIRTPLNAIIGFSSLLKNEELSEENKVFLKNISNSSNHLLALVNDILDFSKIEQGHIELSNINYSVEELLASVDGIARILIQNQGKDIQFTYNLSQAVDRFLQGDPDRIKQILYNFVSNAVKFTDSGTIVLEAKLLDPATLVFSVSDTGIGIDATKVEDVFQSFIQADIGINRKYGGTGLGLTISRKLAELMGGKIWLESNTQEKHGTTFYFAIPYLLSNGNPEDMEKIKKIENENRSCNILVVEDNKVNQMLTLKLLDKLGHKGIIAENGMEAIQILESENTIDLVLMDIQMPVMDGLEATKILKEKEKAGEIKTIPVIALSAGAFHTDKESALECGCDDYIPKPIDFKILSRTLDKYLGGN